MDSYLARMPFSCFKYPGFTLSSKRYHTAAKHSAAFFDSTFNHIRQNSQLQTVEALGQGAKRYPHPHPANAAATNYLQYDFALTQSVAQDDEQNNNNISANAAVPALKNPINIVLPFNQDNVILSVNKTNYHEVLKTFPVSVINSSKITSQLQTQQAKIDKKQLHTSAQQKQQQQHQKKEKLPQQEPSPGSSPTLVVPETTKYFSPGEIEEVELSDRTFLLSQTKAINSAYQSGQFEKVNSLYMAIKRNDLVPSREVYSLVLSSIVRRTIDDSLDEKLSTMLNVYQDLISNKIKPDVEIYSTVISALLEGAVKAAVVPGVSVSGVDFFKIAIDIFNASNCTHLQHFNSNITDLVLIGMNLYPGLVNNTSFMKILEQQNMVEKNVIYYTSLINYCKFTNDSELAISLYEQFKVDCEANDELKKSQFIIYSTFISTLAATGEIALATKFLDKLLTSIKNYQDYEAKVTMLLSSYLLTLSKTNYPKALEIWSQFNRIDWIPEFSYEFYLHLLQDSLHSVPYEESLRLYNYMTALPRSNFAADEYSLSTLLITPRRIDSLSNFLLRAIEHDDKSTVLKMLKESFVRKSHFAYQAYPPLFQYLSNDDLCVRIINTHGLQMTDGFEFLSFLSSNVANLPIFDISKTQFFKRLIDEFSLDSYTPRDLYGFLQVWSSVFNVGEMSMEMMEVCAPLLIEFHDLNSYYAQLPSQEVLDLKLTLTDYFMRLQEEVDTEHCGEMVKQAIALIEEVKH
ncbi:CYFA0S29e00584g1_1 [Cyberlindnera fabianii]|uniref:Mitochondrial 15S rRNA processing factor CCM1 n=1 Tax=Cyberlindnera fabianii TaxID=36022 RepID=A0A061BCT2_CYBFA|nr:CYFA0S29e00584g1_1 [Cyberlindnera fabianii]